MDHHITTIPFYSDSPPGHGLLVTIAPAGQSMKK